MLVSDFDYYLPEELIAQEPVPVRDQSRLLVVRRADCCLEHRHFRDLVDFIGPGDCLVVNSTRVFPARLTAWNCKSGSEVEVFLLRQSGEDRWEALVRPGRKARNGTVLRFSRESEEGELKAVVLSDTLEGGRVLRFNRPGSDKVGPVISELINTHGQTPLPPYIKRPAREEDVERYQAVYAETTGSVAAPTAGLHFTDELLEKLRDRGVSIARLVLHVGLGTFRPVRAARVEEHRIHAEYFEVPPEACDLVNSTHARGGRVFAVGTTVARTLESRADQEGLVTPGSGWTDLFIYPGYRFRAVDALVTNFHLPRSTLLMLVSAFAGREMILRAYREAVEERYRFFSYGDAMLII
ncbi:MAG: tRNA preQ1(34) S-adenosylmethionine ribosyltransferase-isomerase QueA [Firmicutes bacterium]|nr:tRNA preQ1(34) S-adenosylmethionine ribosyltransferase-isomerase QueA [Bacillota bacterium]